MLRGARRTLCAPISRTMPRNEFRPELRRKITTFCVEQNGVWKKSILAYYSNHISSSLLSYWWQQAGRLNRLNTFGQYDISMRIFNNKYCAELLPAHVNDFAAAGNRPDIMSWCTLLIAQRRNDTMSKLYFYKCEVSWKPTSYLNLSSCSYRKLRKSL